MIRWTLDTIDMNTGKPDSSGASWWVTDSTWFDAPDMRQNIIDRSLGHGSIMASSFMDRRRVMISGVCRVVGTEDNVWRSRDRFMAALTTFTAPKNLAVNEYGPTKNMSYWSASGATVQITPGGFTWSVVLICEDPRKYSSVTTTSSNIASGANATIIPYGTFQTPPIFTVLNIASGANTANITITDTVGGSLIGTLQVLSYLSAVGETKLVIDAMNRTVQGTNSTGGNVVNRYGSLNTASMSWFDLMAANNVIAFTGTSYAAQVSWRDAWL